MRPIRPNNRPAASSGSGSSSRVRPSGASGAGREEPRRGKQLGGGLGVTSVSRPLQNRPAVLGKLDPSGHSAVNNWDSGTWEKFGPGGFRSFNETLGPEVCQRPGLFRHPTDCTQFYECYWDKWIEKFTLHIFPCPVAMAVRQYDESISACNWPFLGQIKTNTCFVLSFNNLCFQDPTVRGVTTINPRASKTDCVMQK